MASAPANARAWLLAEHPGPWPEEATDAPPPPRWARLSTGPENWEPGSSGSAAPAAGTARHPGRVCGLDRRGPARPRRGDLADVDAPAGELDGAAEGRAPTFGVPTTEPLLLVCTHGRRDVCCARLGGPLARRLARTWPAGVWETTHARPATWFAANLVILPHGLYYGPVAVAAAEAAIAAYQRGEVLLTATAAGPASPRTSSRPATWP